MPRFIHIFALCIGIISLLSPSAQAAVKLQKYTYGGSNYVSLHDVKNHYRFPKLHINGKSVTLENSVLKIKFSVNSHECLMNGIKFILAKPVVLSGTKPILSEIDLYKLIEPVLRPEYIAGTEAFRTIILDPGHGGKDPGAVNKYGTEAYYNLKVANRTKAYLEKQGFKVIMTRKNDTFLSLSERVQLANKRANAVFISIHFNAGGGGKAKGLETFTLSPKGVAHHGSAIKASDHRALRGNRQDSQNIALATAIHSSSKERLAISDRGIKRARYSVLTSIKHPAILIEGGFMSHPTEAKKIHTSSYQDKLAKSIAEGIMKYKLALLKTKAAHKSRL